MNTEIGIFIGVSCGVLLVIGVFMYIIKVNRIELEKKMNEDAKKLADAGIGLINEIQSLKQKLKFKEVIKMNEDVKKLAKYLAGKIQTAEDNIKAHIDDKFDELLTDEEEVDEDTGGIDSPFDDDELDEEFDIDAPEDEPDYEGNRKVDIKEEERKKKDAEKEAKKKKKRKGLFKKKPKKDENDEEF